MNKIRISSYIEHKSSNYGLNSIKIEIGNVTFWFSYNTVVAFQVQDNPKVVSENLWRQTTRKHLTAIDSGDVEERIDRASFEKLLSEVLEQFQIVQPIVG